MLPWRVEPAGRAGALAFRRGRIPGALLAAAILASPGTSQSAAFDSSDVLDWICRANGLDKLPQLRALEFTFNVSAAGLERSRSWRWVPSGDSVYRDGVFEPPPRSRDFVNDLYWLAFPWVARDSRDQVDVTVKHGEKSPLEGSLCSLVEVRYVSEKGFTPKDAYRLYVDGKGKVVEWAFLKSGETPPALVTSWEVYRDFDGVRLSLDRRGTGDFRVHFTSVKLIPR